jgi:hypothetical protein
MSIIQTEGSQDGAANERVLAELLHIEKLLYRIEIGLEEANGSVASLRIKLGGAIADSPGYESSEAAVSTPAWRPE